LSSPTSRSLEYLRERGWVAHVVEKRNPFTKKLKDCFGADIVAIHPAQKLTLWVQATSGTNHRARVHKCRLNPEVRNVLQVGHLFEVWSWEKNKKRQWKLRTEKLRLSDLHEARSGV
jgi:hypothetical protein